MPRNRFWNADNIWNGGASNPRGVANALLQAMDEARNENADPARDPAVQVILDHLCFLCGVPQPSLCMTAMKWDAIMKQVEARK